MSEVLRILCVHGVGHGEADPDLQPAWQKAIADGIHRWDADRQIECDFVAYDDLFAAAPLDAEVVAAALARLAASGIVHAIGNLFRPARGLGDLGDSLRWTAGMVAQWADNAKLRAAARKRVLDRVAQFQPHVICAHSLGTLISYDAFARKEGRGALADRRFVSFGSQIGNPFVCSTLGGRIVALKADRWFHLFNPHDKAFTARLRLSDPRFTQLITDFDLPGFLDHDATAYLSHAVTVNTVWREIASPAVAAPAASARGLAARKAPPLRAAAPAVLKQPQRRALLVGINDYPNPPDRLQGCVNDVFLLSSVLQEHGFAAEDIRTVLDERATVAAIRERLDWLLDGAEDGDERVFFYSGHGAQLPGYGAHEKVDHVDECLVPFDFNWTRETAIVDDEFHDLYSQLPYGTHFVAILDCCHSGGMTRDGGPRVRGLTPPDDIRHRMLRWNAQAQMWAQREFESVGRDVKQRKQSPKFYGATGATNKLGRGAALRVDDEAFETARKEFGHFGPFMPVLLEACRENEFSYEYRHGVTSYGAFTYALAQILREFRQRRQRPNWRDLLAATTKRLHDLKYSQTPVLAGPKVVTVKPVTW